MTEGVLAPRWLGVEMFFPCFDAETFLWVLARRPPVAAAVD